MKISDWTKEILKIYTPVSVLSRRNGKQITRLRHNKLKKDIVMISSSEKKTIYDFLKKIHSQNIVDVYDSIDFEDGNIVIEEYLSGITVSEVLETGLYSYDGAKSVMLSVCNALDVLHKFGFIYRDIKPENVFITDNGECKIIDFDACRVSDTEKCKDTIPFGTPGFASPEQYGISQSDTRSDIYSAGIFFNVMLTGTHPTEKLASGKARNIILKCTQISPEKRFSNVKELAKTI